MFEEGRREGRKEGGKKELWNTYGNGPIYVKGEGNNEICLENQDGFSKEVVTDLDSKGS